MKEGSQTQIIPVHVRDADEALGILNTYIQSLSAEAFNGKDSLRKNALGRQFETLQKLFDLGAYPAMIDILNNSIRIRTDDFISGGLND